MKGAVRLDRLLSSLGYGSRREIQAMARAGAVTLDEAPLFDATARIELAAGARLAVDGRPVDPLPPLTLVMHKPAGLVCSHAEAGRSVFEILPERWRRRSPPLSTVGRLDADTTGLLLITDDGALLHRLISPRSKIAKRYLASLERPMTGREAALFASGMMLEGETKPLKPARLDMVAATEARVWIEEGRYHQVRRMFAAAGDSVTELRREAIGGLELPPDLAPGDWRPIRPAELARVFEA